VVSSLLQLFLVKSSSSSPGNFAAWGTLFSLCECTLLGVRHTDDSWNRIAAGAFTSGALSLRGGRGAILRGAIVGGSLLALIEGASHLMNRMMSPDPNAAAMEEEMRRQKEDQSRQAERQLRKRDLASKPSTPDLMTGSDNDEWKSTPILLSDEPANSEEKTEQKGLFARVLGR
jgi:hypothetical protein